MKTNVSGIYIIRNKINGKVYIGSAKNIRTRWYRHKSNLKMNKHHSIKLQNSYNKNGIDSFEYMIIQYCNINELKTKEQYWIDFFDSYNEGYNCSKESSNPMLGRNHSDETKQKMSKSQKGRIISEDSKQKMKDNHFLNNGGTHPMLGKKASLEWKNKNSESHKGKKLSQETKDKISLSSKGEKNGFYGRKHSEETKEKIRLFRLGKKFK